MFSAQTGSAAAAVWMALTLSGSESMQCRKDRESLQRCKARAVVIIDVFYAALGFLEHFSITADAIVTTTWTARKESRVFSSSRVTLLFFWGGRGGGVRKLCPIARLGCVDYFVPESRIQCAFHG